MIYIYIYNMPSNDYFRVVVENIEAKIKTPFIRDGLKIFKQSVNIAVIIQTIESLTHL